MTWVSRFAVSILWKIGSKKANVLPVPVADCPIISLPVSANGMTWDCIPVGTLIPALSSPATNGALTPNVSNDSIIMYSSFA